MSEEDKSEEKSVEEIEAEYKAFLAKKVEKFKAEEVKAEELRLEEETKKAEEEAEAKQLERDEKFAEDYGLVKKGTPDPVLGGGKSKPENAPDEGNPFYRMKNGAMIEIPSQVEFHKSFSKLHGFDEKRVNYASPEFLQGKEKSYGFVESDSGCDDNVAAWSPADIWCDLIWQQAMCGRQLSGVITLRACDINAGDGLVVQIRAINRSTLTTTALSGCECATCTSNVFSTYPITLDRLDEYKVLCNLDLWDVGYELRDAVIQSMANEFIVGIDLRIWNALIGATPGYTETPGASLICDPAFSTASPTCCNYAANLYREIIQLRSRMRAAGYGEDGFFLVLHPTVADFLKYKEGISPPAWMWSQIHMDGLKLDKIGNNISVIEYCGARACTDAPGAVMAVMLDPKRAVGEAYGYKPKFLADEDPIECDSWKLIYRTYVGIDVLDTGAIGHIVNP